MLPKGAPMVNIRRHRAKKGDFVAFYLVVLPMDVVRRPRKITFSVLLVRRPNAC